MTLFAVIKVIELYTSKHSIKLLNCKNENYNTIQSIAPDELFHQIALVSVKPLLATTISHEI